MSRHARNPVSESKSLVNPQPVTEPQRGRRSSGRRSAVPPALAVVCGAALAAGVGVPPAAATTVLRPAGARVADARSDVVSLVNARRAQHGCGALSISGPLSELAQDYSTEMGTQNFFSHTDPAGRSPWDRARALGITNLGGENIAMGQPTPRAVVAAWMSSSGHRANILDCSYHTIGVGVYYGSGGPWWTEDFGY